MEVKVEFLYYQCVLNAAVRLCSRLQETLATKRKSCKKAERAITTLGHMGPAVFNGGFSTFLAFALLGFSDAYIFNTFFKLFTSVVLYGLFHGMVFLPVILSLVKPAEKLSSSEKYSTAYSAKNSVPTMNGIHRSTKAELDHEEGLPTDSRSTAQKTLLTQSAVGSPENCNGSAPESGKW